MSILILSDRVDKWFFLHRRRPSIISRVHNGNRLSQLPENSLAKAQKTEPPAPQKQAMLAPNHQACPGHKQPMPQVNQTAQKPGPIPPQDGEALALKINVLDFILEDLIAESADR